MTWFTVYSWSLCIAILKKMCRQSARAERAKREGEPGSWCRVKCNGGQCCRRAIMRGWKWFGSSARNAKIHGRLGGIMRYRFRYCTVQNIQGDVCPTLVYDVGRWANKRVEKSAGYQSIWGMCCKLILLELKAIAVIGVHLRKWSTTITC
jgi:hypothetical protein